MDTASQNRSCRARGRTLDSISAWDLELRRLGRGVSSARAGYAKAQRQNAIGSSSYQFARHRPIRYGIPAFGSASLCRSLLIEGVAARLAGATVAGAAPDAQESHVEPIGRALYPLQPRRCKVDGWPQKRRSVKSQSVAPPQLRRVVAIFVARGARSTRQHFRF
jgi:hypothetical protein